MSFTNTLFPLMTRVMVAASPTLNCFSTVRATVVVELSMGSDGETDAVTEELVGSFC